MSFVNLITGCLGIGSLSRSSVRVKLSKLVFSLESLFCVLITDLCKMLIYFCEPVKFLNNSSGMWSIDQCSCEYVCLNGEVFLYLFCRVLH